MRNKIAQHKPNRLANEKSPYLLQHAYNPVDWFPWSEEAFAKAKSEDKPIFLSIGYSTCHWCHVMERESFEDEEVAEILNKHFVSIKVDREERPDIDHIYMEVCSAFTGQGGWPLTIIMTPDKHPFFAGTYFPKHDAIGLPGLITILKRISREWDANRESLLQSSKRVVEILNRRPPSKGEVSIDTAHEAYKSFDGIFDPVYGGFGTAPKFPVPHNLFFLLRYWYAAGEGHALEMCEKTLDAMYRGGIYDHIGFGFARYSTDRKWLKPHFEKMLCDNALLAMAYLEAYSATRKPKYAEIARQIFEYVLRDMTSPDGAFYSAEDADSEGVEGKFYVLTRQEVLKVLGNQAGEKFSDFFDITREGNFEAGTNIPNLIHGLYPEHENEFVEECRKKLFEHRQKRGHPHKDDKILTDWNGLMIAALALGCRVLGDKGCCSAAERAAGFICSNLIREDGRVMARYREGETAYLGYADDYAFLIWGLIELYETTYKPEYLKYALRLNDDMLKLFWDDAHGGLFIYGSDGEALITRPKEVYDGAMPSGNSVAALNLLRLGRLTGRGDLEHRARQLFEAFGADIKNAKTGHAFVLSAFLFSQSPGTQVIIAKGDDETGADEMVRIIRERFRPFTVSMVVPRERDALSAIAPFVKHYTAIGGKATAYVCENFTCQKPITGAMQLQQVLGANGSVGQQH